MKANRWWRVAGVGLILGGGAGSAACVSPGETLASGDVLERRFAVAGPPSIEVRNATDGDTTVRAVSGNEVRVRTRLVGPYADELDLDIRQTGERIVVSASRVRRRWLTIAWRPTRVHIDIDTPARSDLTVRNDDGDLAVHGLDGRLSLTVDDGDLRAEALSGALTVRGDDGTVELRDVTGTLDATTDDGDLRVDGVLSTVRTRTDDGDVDIRAAPGSRMDDDWSVAVDDGRLGLTLPPDFAADLDVRTDRGAIEIEPPLGPRAQVERHRVSTTLNGGGRTLRVRGDDARIRLHQ